MQISDYSVKMDSSHELLAYSKKEESLVQWVGDGAARKEAYGKPVNVNISQNMLDKLQKAASEGGGAEALEDAVSLTLSPEAMKGLIPKINPVSSASNENSEVVGMDEFMIKLFEEITEKLFKKKIKIKLIDAKALGRGGSSGGKIEDVLLKKILGNNGDNAGEGQQLAGWGLDYSYHEIKAESETVSFNARAVVKTADGREINIDIALNMSRTFIEEKSLNIKAGDALIDPLVINLNGAPPSLSDTKFEFDLDADGKSEQISNLSAGSAFLALDKNNDGRINDGRELFGPSTGSGFKELSAHDDDRNGWIDENDSIYQNLRVWSKNPDGSSNLMALGQAGIGAIYLGKADTQFSINDAENNTKGKLAQTGFYLNENGTAGLVHELDLAV